MSASLVAGERVISDSKYLGSIPGVVSSLKATFAKGVTKDKNWRIQQLKGLLKMFTENRDKICEGLNKDMKRDHFCSFVSELAATELEIQHAISNLSDWAKSKSLPVGLANKPGHAELVPEPLGVVLLMSAWNFPYLTLIQPAIGAIAAGNCVLLKPASLAGHSSILIADLIPKYLDPAAVAVVEGAAQTGSFLLEQKFDKIMYTGGCGVAKVVMAAAAKHLTPVALELGGKNPCIVTDSVGDIELAARRVAWGRFAINAGQICVSPDYLLVHESIGDKFVSLIEQSVKEFFLDSPDKSEYNSRIINESHTKRIANIINIDKNFIAFGGNVDISDKYIAPTILNFKTDLEAFTNSQAMKDEIFGPVLPVYYFKDLDWCLSFINQRDKPLTLSVFASTADAKIVAGSTSSGSVSVNDCLTQKSELEIPFGGVGASGFGRYNGRYSFETFSHYKPILHRSIKSDVDAKYPPYSPAKREIFNHLHQYLLGHKSLVTLGIRMVMYNMKPKH